MGYRFASQDRGARTLILFLTAALLAPRSLFAYATFTHLELIDLAWNENIRPLILQKYPAATNDELDEAHAYAYGGCLIQDLGYYPFGKKTSAIRSAIRKQSIPQPASRFGSRQAV